MVKAFLLTAADMELSVISMVLTSTRCPQQPFTPAAVFVSAVRFPPGQV